MKALTALITVAMLATSSVAEAQPPRRQQPTNQSATTLARDAAIAATVISLIGWGAGFFRTPNKNRSPKQTQHVGPT